MQSVVTYAKLAIADK